MFEGTYDYGNGGLYTNIMDGYFKYRKEGNHYIVKPTTPAWAETDIEITSSTMIVRELYSNRPDFIQTFYDIGLTNVTLPTVK